MAKILLFLLFLGLPLSALADFPANTLYDTVNPETANL
jgi:hypothetical protein